MKVKPNYPTVLRPQHEGGTALEPGENEVPDTEYWRRRVSAGDVSLVKEEAIVKQDVMVEEAKPVTTHKRRHAGEE